MVYKNMNYLFIASGEGDGETEVAVPASQVTLSWSF